MGRQGFEVGACLVGHIARMGGSVRANDDKIYHALLHHVATSIVGNKGVGNTVVGQFPAG